MGGLKADENSARGVTDTPAGGWHRFKARRGDGLAAHNTGAIGALCDAGNGKLDIVKLFAELRSQDTGLTLLSGDLSGVGKTLVETGAGSRTLKFFQLGDKLVLFGRQLLAKAGDELGVGVVGARRVSHTSSLPPNPPDRPPAETGSAPHNRCPASMGRTGVRDPRGGRADGHR